MSCVFCRIISGEIQSPTLYADDDFIVIRDIEPIAAAHYLAVPLRHFGTLDEMTKDDEATLGRIFAKIPQVALSLGLGDGYRLIINQGESAGQTVPHLHIHILGGQKLSWESMK